MAVLKRTLPPVFLFEHGAFSGRNEINNSRRLSVEN